MSLFYLWALPWVDSAEAHSIHVVAYPDGNQLRGEGGYSDGSLAANARIKVIDADGKMIGETRTSSDGTFGLVLLEGRAPFEVEINDGAGHRSTFTLSESDMAPLLEAENHIGEEVSPDDKEQRNDEIKDKAIREVEAANGSITHEEWVRILRQELAPIKSQLAQLSAQKKTSPADIMGGLGWIAGLIGLGMWWNSRKKS